MNSEMAALEGAITFYSPSLYAAFEREGEEAARALAQATDEASMRQPLWMTDPRTGELPQVDLPFLGERSGVYCIAVIAAYLVWTQQKAGGPGAPSLSPLVGAARLGYELWRREADETGLAGGN